MATKQTDAVATTEQQLDAVAGGIILNNDGGRGRESDRFGGQEGEAWSQRPTGRHEIPWWRLIR